MEVLASFRPSFLNTNWILCDIAIVEANTATAISLNDVYKYGTIKSARVAPECTSKKSMLRRHINEVQETLTVSVKHGFKHFYFIQPI